MMKNPDRDYNQLMRRVTLIVIASYFTFQIVIGLLVKDIGSASHFVKLMMMLQIFIPAIAILFWSNAAGLFTSDIFPLEFKFRITDLLIILLPAIGFFLLAEGLSNGILTLLPEHLFQEFSEQLYLPSFKILKIDNGLDLLIIGSSMVIFVPILEELVFRGLALGVFRKAAGINQGSVYSALLWAFLHMNPIDFLSMMLMGLVLAYITFKSGSLWLPIAIHMIFSLTELIYLNTFDYSGLMDIPGWTINGSMILFGLVLIVAGVQITDRVFSVKKSKE